MPRPTKDDQQFIERDIRDYGQVGYGLWYVLGSLRARGMSSAEADACIQAVDIRTREEGKA